MFLKDDFVVWSLIALIGLVVVVLSFVLWVASRPEKEIRVGQRRKIRMRNDTLRASFRQAVELIEANIAGRAQKLSLPWVLVLNEGAGAKPLPVSFSGVAQALSADAAASASAEGISWNFFDKGIVINMLGAYLGTPDSEDASERPWEEFLSLCRDYRPERPFDSLVITVPVELLMKSESEARMELSRLAKLANRRLWMAQNRFAMRFSVYVVVSGCEGIPGFAAFSRSLPEIMRKSILGWSSPFELSAGYQSSWVDETINQAIQTLSDTSAELFALNNEGDSAAYFMLPGQIESIRSQLQLYVDELMRPSSYHEPFLMRGIYFAGDSNEAAERNQRVFATRAMGQTNGSDSRGLVPKASGALKSTFDAELLPLSDEGESGPDDDTYSLSPEPVFLRDLFEHKIFPEFGLARPSASQLTSFPLLGRGARWTGAVILGGWGVGLLIGSIILHAQSIELNRILVKIQQYNSQMALANQAGLKMSVDSQNTQALSLMALMEQMEGKRLWSVFMPGSWPWIDSLSADAKNGIDKAFGEIAAATLKRGFQTQVSQLTGVPQDEDTGELITGASCSIPAGISADETKRAPIGFLDMPEYASLMGYVSAVQQLDIASQAMQRLQASGSPADPRDLQLLVKQVTGTELNSVSQRSADLFRSKASSANRVRLDSVREIIGCALRLRLVRLGDQAFDNNVVLLSQQELRASIANLTAAGEDSNDGEKTLETLETLVILFNDIKTHEALLSTGSGGSAWMTQAHFQPGKSWELMMSKVSATQLLGGDVAHQINEKFEAEYKRFSATLKDEMSGDDMAEVIWDEKEQRYALGTSLQNLKTSISTLLSEPYMALANNLPAPELNLNQAVSWDLARLDQAIATQEQFKRFKSELFPRFPMSSQRAIDQIVRTRMTNQIMTMVNSALLPGGRVLSQGSDFGVMEAERVRLVKLQQLLNDLGARREAESLRSLTTRDAARRLQALDDTLQRAELYATRGRSFSSWNGEKGPVLGAFGLPDIAALQPYLAQQAGRVEALSKEADAIMGLLDPGNTTSSQALRWQAIGRDLERARLKNPNSSLQMLEGFLMSMSGDVDMQNCTERLAGKVPSGRAADFFAERHAQLASSLQQRCSELRQNEMVAQWQTFSTDFNRTLAGRPPFAQPGWMSDAYYVEIDEISPMFKSYDRARPAMQALVRKGSAAAAPVQRFMEQFERTKTFLAPLMPSEENAAVGYDVGVEFRANLQGEVQGNKIIDWTIEIGRQRLSLRDPPKQLRWEPGQAIQLSLRMAKDGQVTPLVDAKQPAMTVDGKTLILRYADGWSLFNLIGRQREVEARGDGRSQLIKIEFPMQVETLPPIGGTSVLPPATARVGQLAQSQNSEVPEKFAKVYLRLTLSPPGKRTPLAWPGTIPTRAPDAISP
jgi:type VI secretion system protein ImpL